MQRTIKPAVKSSLGLATHRFFLPALLGLLGAGLLSSCSRKQEDSRRVPAPPSIVALEAALQETPAAVPATVVAAPSQELQAIREELASLELEADQLSRQVIHAGTPGTPPITAAAISSRTENLRARIAGLVPRYQIFKDENDLRYVPAFIQAHTSVLLRYVQLRARSFAPMDPHAFPSTSGAVQIRQELDPLCMAVPASPLLAVVLGTDEVFGDHAAIVDVKLKSASPTLAQAEGDSTEAVPSENYQICFKGAFIDGIVASQREHRSDPENRVLNLSKYALLSNLARTQVQAGLLAGRDPLRTVIPGQQNLPADELNRILERSLVRVVRENLAAKPLYIYRSEIFTRIRAELYADITDPDADFSQLEKFLSDGIQERRAHYFRLGISRLNRTSPVWAMASNSEREAILARILVRSELGALLQRLTELEELENPEALNKMQELISSLISSESSSLSSALRAWSTELAPQLEDRSLRNKAAEFMFADAAAALAQVRNFAEAGSVSEIEFSYMASLRKEESAFLGGSERLHLWRELILRSVSGAAAVQNFLRVSEILMGTPGRFVAPANTPNAPRIAVDFVESELEKFAQALEERIRRNGSVPTVASRGWFRDLADARALIAVARGLRLAAFQNSEKLSLAAAALSERERERYREVIIATFLSDQPLARTMRERGDSLNARALGEVILRMTANEAARIQNARSLVELDAYVGGSQVVKALIDNFPREARARRDWLRERLQPSVAGDIWENFFFQYVVAVGIPLIAVQGLRFVAPRIMPRWAAYLQHATAAVDPFLKGYTVSSMAAIGVHIGLESFNTFIVQRNARNEIARIASIGTERSTLLFDAFDEAQAGRDYANVRQAYFWARAMDLAFLIGIPAANYIGKYVFGAKRIRRNGFWFERVPLARVHDEHFAVLGAEPNRHRWDPGVIQDLAAVRLREIGAMERNYARAQDAQRAVLHSRDRLLAEFARVEKKLERLSHYHRFEFEELGLARGNWNMLEWRQARDAVANRVSAGELPAYAKTRVDAAYELLLQSVQRHFPMINTSELQPFLAQAMMGRGRHEQMLADLVTGGRLPNDYPLDYDVIPIFRNHNVRTEPGSLQASSSLLVFAKRPYRRGPEPTNAPRIGNRIVDVEFTDVQ